MDELPAGMMTLDRLPDPIFAPDEDLYRRFDPDDLDGVHISIDALELPDMSVNRSKYGPAEWTRLLDTSRNWGVLAFRVGDIPPELLHLGTIRYSFAPEHVPLKRNYPHAEVRSYKEGVHIDLKNYAELDPDLNQRWRQQLAWKCRVILKPDGTK